MTIIEDYAYHAPSSLAEAVKLLATVGPRARVLAGGTDLVPWLRDQRVEVDALIDLKRVGELASLEIVRDQLAIGALVTFSELVSSPLVIEQLPVIAEMAASVASVGIRNRATMAGNICSAVPSCDAGPVLLALEAEVHLVGPDGDRRVPISAWFQGPRRVGHDDLHPVGADALGSCVCSVDPLPRRGSGSGKCGDSGPNGRLISRRLRSGRADARASRRRRAGARQRLQ